MLEALRRADDFRTAQQLVGETARNGNQVSAALHSLRKYKAVDCLASDSTLYWYALPPEGDTRKRRVDEKAPELKPRKPRKPRKVKL